MSESDVRALIALLERTLGRQWLDLAAYLRSANKLDDIDRMLRTGDFAGIMQSVRDAAVKFASDESAAFGTAGARTATALADQVDGLVHFDVVNSGAVRWAQQNQLELVSGLTDEARRTMNQVLVAGARSSANPLETARDLRDSLGLTPDQQGWLASYRAALEQGDFMNALGRELSHGYSDRTIAAAARAAEPLTAAQIDTAVERYRANIVTYRAENIARTEGLKVAHQAQDEAMRQAVASGKIDAREMQGVWNAGPATKNAREAHQHLDGTTRAFGEKWRMPDGIEMSGPGDPAGGAKWCASCRCAKSFRIRRLAA